MKREKGLSWLLDLGCEVENRWMRDMLRGGRRSGLFCEEGEERKRNGTYRMREREREGEEKKRKQ